jgi:hypothetical protein
MPTVSVSHVLSMGIAPDQAIQFARPAMVLEHGNV